VHTVKLKNELEFEADMRVTLKNQKKSWLGNLSDLTIAEFAVPLESIMTRCKRPQFFNILNENGQFMGQILANFYLMKYKKDPKFRKDKTYKSPLELTI
jgi:hypothetical protein